MPCVFSQPCSRSWTQPLVVTWCNASSDTSVRRLMAFLGVPGHLCHKSQVQNTWKNCLRQSDRIFQDQFFENIKSLIKKLDTLKLLCCLKSCQRSNGYYNNGSIIVCSSTWFARILEENFSAEVSGDLQASEGRWRAWGWPLLCHSSQGSSGNMSISHSPWKWQMYFFIDFQVCRGSRNMVGCSVGTWDCKNAMCFFLSTSQSWHFAGHGEGEQADIVCEDGPFAAGREFANIFFSAWDQKLLLWYQVLQKLIGFPHHLDTIV